VLALIAAALFLPSLAMDVGEAVERKYAQKHRRTPDQGVTVSTEPMCTSNTALSCTVQYSSVGTHRCCFLSNFGVRSSTKE